MTPEQFIAIIGACTALVAAIGGLVLQVRALNQHLNGRMEELLTEARSASLKEGELSGRDFATSALLPGVTAAKQTSLAPIAEPVPAEPGWMAAARRAGWTPSKPV